jgi:hypothetical protein
MMAYNARPGGVTLVAVLVWLTAILQIGLSVLILLGVLSSPEVSLPSTWVAVVVGVITLMVSFGLFGARNIARVVVTVSLALSILSAALQAVIHQTPDVIAGSVITAALAAIGIALLYTRRANLFFS